MEFNNGSINCSINHTYGTIEVFQMFLNGLKSLQMNILNIFLSKTVVGYIELADISLSCYQNFVSLLLMILVPRLFQS